jgi:hypothetical protein
MATTENTSAVEQPLKKFRSRDPEFWIAIGALIVSAIAMLTSLMQVSLQRNQERALVWPHVSARPSYSAEGFAFTAYNKGLGPALVRNVQLKVDGKSVDSWSEVVVATLGDNKDYGWENIKSNNIEDSIMASTEAVTMFKIAWDEKTRQAFSDGNRISVEICYCSFLDECWISKSGLDHERVDRCNTK